MTDDDTRHSGSRWEPTPASVPEKDVPAGDFPAKDEPAVDGPADAASMQAVEEGPAAAGSDDSHAAQSGLRADEPGTERIASQTPSDGDGSAGDGSAGNGPVGNGSVGRGRVGGTAPDAGGSTGTGTGTST